MKKYLIATLSGILAAAAIAGFVSIAQARIYNPSSGGITSLNGLTGATQTFANDTNVTISSSGTAHTLGWSGSLAAARGGTGTTTWLTNSVPYFNGTRMTESTSLTFNGTALTAAQLAFTNATGTSVYAAASSTIQILNADTLDTGQGANELYDMDQNVLTTSNVTFVGLAFTNATGSSITLLASSTVQVLNSTTGAIGTLTLTNALGRAYGGTGTTTWVTGDVVFANGTTLTSDPTNFYWDNTNNRLGLGGTTTPQRTLSVSGPIVSSECNLTDGATITFDLSLCNQGKVVLGDNRALDFTNEKQALGQGIRVVVCQDGTGSRTLTHDSSVRWAGGSAPTLTTTANKCDVLAGFTSMATGTPIILLDKVLSF